MTFPGFWRKTTAWLVLRGPRLTRSPGDPACSRQDPTWSSSMSVLPPLWSQISSHPEIFYPLYEPSLPLPVLGKTDSMTSAAAAAKSLQSCPTLQPHRQQLTRLPHPWDSLGKNTGVGCHFLLQCMKVKSESEVAQSFPTLPDPMDCSLPGSSAHGIFQARVLEWGAIAFSLMTSRPKQERLPPSSSPVTPGQMSRSP